MLGGDCGEEELFMNISTLQSTYNYINWREYFFHILPQEVQLDEEDYISVLNVCYFKKLGSLIAATETEILANYLSWRVAEASVDFLPDVFRKRKDKFIGKLAEFINLRKARPSKCLTTVSDYYSRALDALYVRRHFNEGTRDQVSKITQSVKKEFQEMLSNADWMDNTTKEIAMEKLEDVTYQVGFADELLTDKNISEYYSKALGAIVEGEFFENFLKLNHAKLRSKFRTIREPADGWNTIFKATDVNSYFFIERNSIVLPSAILQGWFFDHDSPAYMNYARIGFIVGHELSHVIFENILFTSDSMEAFLKKSQCFNDQYSRFVDPLMGDNLNETIKQEENIADNGTPRVCCC